MDKLSDSQVYDIAKPIWDNMNQCSNNMDYEGFSRDFSLSLKETISRERFESQCQKFSLLTSLILGAEPVAYLRRKEGYGVVFKQLSFKEEGEFMGNLILSIENGKALVIDATIY